MELIRLLWSSLGRILDLFLSKKQKDLVSDMVPEAPVDENLILVRYDKIENSLATGILFFKNFEIAFKSGGWGKGAAPKGEYSAVSYRVEAGEAYSRFGIGFFVHIVPQFETDRTELGIHFDGSVPGTLGCIGLQCSNVEDAIKVRNLFRDAFDRSGGPIKCRII